MPMTLAQKFFMLYLLSGYGFNLTLVNASGTQVTDAAQAARVCGLPTLGPAGFYIALGVPFPTLADGTGSGDCLAPAAAEDLYRKARIAAGILPAWRAANLTAGQCAAGIVAVEFGNADAGEADHSEQLIEVCGTAPSAAATQTVERLSAAPGTSVRILQTYGPYANPGGHPVLSRWMQGSFPAAIRALYPCACRMTADVAGSCQQASPDGGYSPAPFGTTLGAGMWTGGCATKTCVEAAEVAMRAGLGYSMPVECL
jgi:hypothetical protein